MINHRRVGILLLDLLPFRAWTDAQHEHESGFFARGERQPLVQGAAVVASELRAAGTPAALNRERVRLRAVGAKKAVTHAIETVRLNVRGEVMIRPRLNFYSIKERDGEEIVLDDAFVIARSACVERHLKILVVDLDVVIREFNVGEDTQLARPRAAVPEPDVPQFDVVVQRDEKKLFGVDILVVA